VKTSTKYLSRLKRHCRLRKHLKGTALRPRLAVYRSNRYLYAQLIDDVKGVTLVAASSLERKLLEKFGGKANKTAAAEVGRLISERALALGIKTVVFDRGGFFYHGRIKSLADAAREGGLDF
jgi:large subunit ribosomal protein L18